MIKSDKSVIVVLTGSLVKDNGVWRTTNFNEGDNFGILGDRVRVEAAAVLCEKYPEAKVLVLGGKGQLANDNSFPSISSVNADELVALGILREVIMIDEDSNNTWSQLKSMEMLITKYGFTKAFIITNRWHWPRVFAMIEKNESLKRSLSSEELKPIVAEDVLIDHDLLKWQSIIDEAYSSDDMKKRIAIEEKGIEDIKIGRYILD